MTNATNATIEPGTHYFADSAQAWSFMRMVDASPGLIAGYPSLGAVSDKGYSVQVASAPEKLTGR